MRWLLGMIVALGGMAITYFLILPDDSPGWFVIERFAVIVVAGAIVSTVATLAGLSARSHMQSFVATLVLSYVVFFLILFLVSVFSEAKLRLWPIYSIFSFVFAVPYYFPLVAGVWWGMVLMTNKYGSILAGDN